MPTRAQPSRNSCSSVRVSCRQGPWGLAPQAGKAALLQAFVKEAQAGAVEK